MCSWTCANVVPFSPMQLITRLREQRIARIERRVARLTELLNGLDEDMWPDEYADVEVERANLWLLRSKLVKKQPPIYEGA